jgi:hypothetical protein
MAMQSPTVWSEHSNKRAVSIDSELPSTEWLIWRIGICQSVLPSRRPISDDIDAAAKLMFAKHLSDLPKQALDLAFCEIERNDQWFPVPARVIECARAVIDYSSASPVSQEEEKTNVLSYERAAGIAREMGADDIFRKYFPSQTDDS